MKLPDSQTSAIDTARWAVGEQILVVSKRLHQHRDSNDLEKYLRDKPLLEALFRTQEALSSRCERSEQ